MVDVSFSSWRSSISAELKLCRRLVFKNKNQHRRLKPYQSFSRVTKLFGELVDARIDNPEICVLLRRCLESLKSCYRLFSEQFGCGIFMPFSLVVLSSCGRLFKLCKGSVQDIGRVHCELLHRLLPDILDDVSMDVEEAGEKVPMAIKEAGEPTVKDDPPASAPPADRESEGDDDDDDIDDIFGDLGSSDG